jgi:hypothetical protein
MKISFVTSVEDFNGHGGGNQRSKCFFDALKSLGKESHTLENIVIPFSAFEDLEVPGITHQYMANDIEFAMRLSFALDTEHKGALEFVSKVGDSDMIVIDNCYHYPLVENFSEKLKPSTKIVYLSHNFESILKTEIAESLSWEADSKKRYLDFIRKLEISTWTNSDFRIVCSEEDARNLNRELKAPLKSELIPNGANKRGSIQDDHATYLAAMGFESYVLFVSSGHPPNIKGFMDMLGSDFGFIPPNSRLVIVGTSGPIIRDFFFRSKYWETFRHRVTIIEHATEFELDNLYTHCSAILLPILQGSGTSIKAIEAILTGKKIIGTDFAFRGLHQEVFNPPQVSIAKNPRDFKLKVIEALQNGILDFEPHRIANSYLWSSLVIDARNLLNRIIQKE